MTALVQDLRYAFRTLARSPGFTTIAILTLALGIGANTAIFSVVRAVLLQSLPYPESERLVMARERDRTHEMGVAWPTFLDWRERVRGFQGLAGYRMTRWNVSGTREPELLRGAEVSASFFPLLGVRPDVGRAFAETEDRPGATRTVVLSSELWRSRFGGDRSIVGRTVELDALPYVVVGVLPRVVQLLSRARRPVHTRRPQRGRPRLARPRQPLRDARPGAAVLRRHAAGRPRRSRSRHGPDREGLSQDQQRTQGDCDSALRRHGRRNPADALGARRRRGTRSPPRLRQRRAPAPRARGLASEGARDSRGARSRPPPADPAAPDREPSPVGSGWRARARAGGLGDRSPAAPGADGDPAARRHPDRPRRPALHARRVHGDGDDLRPGSRRSGDAARPSGLPARDRARGHDGPVPPEASHHALRLRSRPGVRPGRRLGSSPPEPPSGSGGAPGVRARGVLAMDVALPETTYPEKTARHQFFTRAVEELRSVPGVRSASAVLCPPVAGRCWGSVYVVSDRPTPAPAELPDAAFNIVEPEYFRTMEIPLLQGRFFTDADTADSPLVVIINQSMARRWWPRREPSRQADPPGFSPGRTALSRDRGRRRRRPAGGAGRSGADRSVPSPFSGSGRA